jgi:hypothetical protein
MAAELMAAELMAAELMAAELMRTDSPAAFVGYFYRQHLVGVITRTFSLGVARRPTCTVTLCHPVSAGARPSCLILDPNAFARPAHGSHDDAARPAIHLEANVQLLLPGGVIGARQTFDAGQRRAP